MFCDFLVDGEVFYNSLHINEKFVKGDIISIHGGIKLEVEKVEYYLSTTNSSCANVDKVLIHCNFHQEKIRLSGECKEINI